MTYLDPGWGLPDPDTHSEFYANTTTKRFLAWVVDTIIILVIAIVVLPFTAFVGLFFFAGLFAAVSWTYRIVTIANGSATLGMRLMGIELRTGQGEKLDLPLAAMHVILFSVMCWTFFLQVISIILMMTSARGQGLHDMLLGTAAINRASKWE